MAQILKWQIECIRVNERKKVVTLAVFHPSDRVVLLKPGIR